MADFLISEKDLQSIIGDLTERKTTYPEPPYKVDKSKGEGKASKLELEYRQELLDRYNTYALGVLDAFKKYDGAEFKNKVRTLADTYIRETGHIVDDYIPTIWESKQEVARKKVEELGIPVGEVEKNPEVEKALIEWQKFSMEKIGETVYLNAVNKMLGKNYFKVAYAR